MRLFLKRGIAAFLIFGMILPVFVSCTSIGKNSNDTVEIWGDNINLTELDMVSTKTAPAPVLPDYSGKDTLTVGLESGIGVLSPFFCEDESEFYASDLSHVKLLDTERGGRIVTEGVEGQSFEFDGTDYEYYGIADLDLTVESDGRAVYDFTLREDVFFSDGTNLTADDVIFSMYVLLDPAYDGYSELAYQPISGLGSYRDGMATLDTLMFRVGRENVSNQSFSAGDAIKYWERLDSAGQNFVSDIVEYVHNNYGGESLYQSYGGKWGSAIADSDKLRIAYAMTVWGYAEWEVNETGEYTGALTDTRDVRYDCESSYPDLYDFWRCMYEQYESVSELSEAESEERDIYSYLKEAFGEDYEYYFEIYHSASLSSASTVSGITKTGMYSFRVVMDSYDTSSVYAFSFYVAPLHIYGSRDEYRYTEGRFGFTKGDLTKIKDTDGYSVGAGAYTYSGTDGNVYRFKRNELYYLGCPCISYIKLACEALGDDCAQDIAEGKYDITVCELDGKLISSAKNLNSGGTLDGDIISCTRISRDGYGYIGINASEVKCAQDSASEESKALRQAFCILFSVYKKESVYYYWGERAETAEYPIDKNSWAYPTDVSDAYTRTVGGESIYTDGMSDARRYAAALDAAREFFVLAGYEYDAKSGKLISAPDGASLKYEFLLCGGGTYDSPLYSTAKDTAQALSEIGITLKITDVGTKEELSARLSAGDVQMWGAEMQYSPDPDMYDVYYTKNTPEYYDSTKKNLFYICDATLDTLISDAKKSNDYAQRAQIYGECCDIIFSWGVEVPMYVCYDAHLYSVERMAKDSVLSDMSVYYTWADEAYMIKLS